MSDYIPSDPVADLLATALSIYQSKTRNFSRDHEDDSARRLNAYGLLSLAGIASVVGISTYRVEKAIVGQKRPEVRGNLNPAHLTMLMYLRSLGKPNKAWVKQLVNEGTSVITIARLTGIPQATLFRYKR